MPCIIHKSKYIYEYMYVWVFINDNIIMQNNA